MYELITKAANIWPKSQRNVSGMLRDYSYLWLAGRRDHSAVMKFLRGGDDTFDKIMKSDLKHQLVGF